MLGLLLVLEAVLLRKPGTPAQLQPTSLPSLRNRQMLHPQHVGTRRLLWVQVPSPIRAIHGSWGRSRDRESSRLHALLGVHYRGPRMPHLRIRRSPSRTKQLRGYVGSSPVKCKKTDFINCDYHILMLFLFLICSKSFYFLFHQFKFSTCVVKPS